jgi:Golgi apparatus protein 1
VSPGEGHIASCLYAHEDKISGECAIAVYDGMIALQTALTKLDFYTRVCRKDLIKHCATTEPGQGRLFQCLAANKAALDQDCAAALDSAKSELERLGVVK